MIDPEKLKTADKFLFLLYDRLPYGWVPGRRYAPVLIVSLGVKILVGGAGDASALRSLCNKGLAERLENIGGWRITEAGKARIEQLLAS